jgi:hypothetical protein
MVATRRLTPVLAADMAGYSCLIETDEEGTYERLRHPSRCRTRLREWKNTDERWSTNARLGSH